MILLSTCFDLDSLYLSSRRFLKMYALLNRRVCFLCLRDMLTMMLGLLAFLDRVLGAIVL